MRIGEFQQARREANILDLYDGQMRRFNLAVLLGTLVLACAAIAFLALS
jgi:hypothetical protein